MRSSWSILPAERVGLGYPNVIFWGLSQRLGVSLLIEHVFG